MDETVLVAKYANISYEDAKKIIKCYDDDATIPFLVRYRKHIIGDMTSEELRFIKQMYQLAKNIKSKAESIKKTILGKGELTEHLKHTIDNAQSLPELEDIYAPYKSTKKTKASLLKDVGFDKHAMDLLHGRIEINPDKLTDRKNELLKTKKCVGEMLILLVCDYMKADKELSNLVTSLVEKEYIPLQCTARKSKKTKDKVNIKNNDRDTEKFENYYNFNMQYKYLKPHQVLAINRGEKKKELTVHLPFSAKFTNDVNKFTNNKWLEKGIKYEYRDQIFKESVNQLLTKKIIPTIRKRIRLELTRTAEKAAIDVFSSNLKWLLLSRPVRPHDNYVVLGLDPGFKNGCKVAIVNIKREVLHMGLLYLEKAQLFKSELKALILKHTVNTIALGNGQGCRQTELLMSELIKQEQLNVQYVIVSEQGVSIYSCSKEATEEYPDVKPNFISAISLTKRHFDPLAEYVKVEPKHLGVGMYQHDIDPKKLDEELEEVVSECVSNVGVDINIAPLSILKRIAGLSDSKAKKIIQTREKNGGFKSRKDLLDVKGIGPKTYEQCAGFVKIIPETCLMKETAKNSKKIKVDFNILDQTIIHPDDYDKTHNLIQMAKLRLDSIGSDVFINSIKRFASSANLQEVADKIQAPISTVNLICDALSKPLDYDIRSLSNTPLFKTEIKSLSDLSVGSVVTGRVENVTPFGSFVDIGVNISGLIPNVLSKSTDLHLGQRVSVEITKIQHSKVSLKLIRVIAES